VAAPGRTSSALAVPPRQGAPLHPAKADRSRKGTQGIVALKGEGAAPDDAASRSPESLSPKKEKKQKKKLEGEIVRASTKFEVRLRPKHEDGTPHQENLAILKQLDEASKLVARVRNRVARWAYRRDADWLDAQLEPWPKKIDWAPLPVGPLRNGTIGPISLETLAYRQISSSGELSCLETRTAAAASREVVSRWKEKRWLILVAQTEGLLHYKPHQPISLPHQVVRFGLREDGSADVSMRVLSTKVPDATPITIHIVPRDDRQRLELAAIATGEWKLGQLVLSRHHEKRGRWYLRFSYTRLVPMRPEGGLVVVRRGMRSFLIAAHAETADWIGSNAEVREIVDGGDILAFKRQIDARRRSLGRRNRSGQSGQGATGHGVVRRVAPLMDLSHKEADFTKTRCQQAAAALVKFAGDHGASEVVLEDFTAPKDPEAYWLVKRWPWYELGQACEHACQAAGLRVDRKVVSIDRRTCPSCGHEHQEPPTTSYGGWECVNCGMKRTIDQVDALWMLRMVGRQDGVQRAEKKRRDLTKELGQASGGVMPKNG
jgi:hypothetical protein